MKTLTKQILDSERQKILENTLKHQGSYCQSFDYTAWLNEAVCMKYSDCTSEVAKELVETYINSVLSNVGHDKTKPSWWSEEYWQQDLENRKRSAIEFRRMSSELLEKVNWSDIVVAPSHGYRMFNSVVEQLGILTDRQLRRASANA